MKKIFFIFCSLILTMALLSACHGDKAIEKLSIVSGLKTEYTIGDEPDFSQLQLVAIYNDGSEVYLTAKDVAISPLDTSMIGDHPLNISYDGCTVTVSISVKGRPLSPEPGNGEAPDSEKTIITGVSLPESLALWNTNKKDFINKDGVYTVGDDNDFFFTLKLSVYTSEGEKVDASSYTSVSKVYLPGDDTPLEGDALSKYVSIDEERNAFNFTDEAIGMLFTITTRPKDVPAEDEAKMTKSLRIKVVDGYNVYKAYELNYITNSIDPELTEMIPEETRTQAEIVDDFLRTEKNVTRPESISSIVIHGNLNVKVTDIPSEYFINGDRSQELYDHICIFYHQLTDTDTVFTIHGNYFAIYTYELPSVINEQTGSYSDMASAGQVFCFGSRGYYGGIDYDHTKFIATVNNLMFLGNDPTADNMDVVEKAMRGLMALKSKAITMNVNNSKFQSYYIAMVALEDYHTINVDQTIFYNQFQQHFYLVSSNDIQGGSEEPRVDYPNLTLNISRSHISNSGAPAIITQNNLPKENANKYGGVIVNISDDTHIESWFSGEEAFFKYIGVGSLLVQQVKGVDRLLNKYNSSILKEETRLINGKPTNVKLMNVILFNLPMPDIDNGYDALYNDLVGKTNINGKLTIGDNVIMDMNNYVIDGKPSNFGNPIISELKEKDFSYNVLAKPDGSVGYTAAGDNFKVVSGDITAKDSNDYIVAYYYSLAIVFANYHPIQ